MTVSDIRKNFYAEAAAIWSNWAKTFTECGTISADLELAVAVSQVAVIIEAVAEALARAHQTNGASITELMRPCADWLESQQFSTKPDEPRVLPMNRIKPSNN